MTEAEIEKKAEGYATDFACNGQTGTETLFISPTKKQAFQDGAKWGMEHAVEWHDLRKDPNDLPKESKWYWCKCSNNAYYTAIYDVKLRYWFFRGEIHSIIAWCELPMFEESEE